MTSSLSFGSSQTHSNNEAGPVTTQHDAAICNRSATAPVFCLCLRGRAAQFVGAQANRRFWVGEEILAPTPASPAVQAWKVGSWAFVCAKRGSVGLPGHASPLPFKYFKGTQRLSHEQTLSPPLPRPSRGVHTDEISSVRTRLSVLPPPFLSLCYPFYF